MREEFVTDTDFRRWALPRLVWCVSAVICVVLLVGRTARFEYVPMDPAMREAHAVSGSHETAQEPVRARLPGEDPSRSLGTAGVAADAASREVGRSAISVGGLR